MPKPVLFIQGGGQGAHAEDAPLATSLQRALGPDYVVRYPHMPNEADPEPESWKKQIATELAVLDGEVILVGHSVGATMLLKYLAEDKVDRPIAGLFLLATPSWDEQNWNFEDLKLPDTSRRGS